MDLQQPIVYNGLSVNTLTAGLSGGQPLSGYMVDSFNPSEVDVAAYMDKRGQIDGMDAADVYLGARHATMILGVYGSTRGDFWDKAQDVLAAFSPTLAYNADTANLGFLPLTFYQPTADISTWPTSTYPKGIPLQYYLRPMAVPGFVVERDKDGGFAAKGVSKKLAIRLTSRDPRKYLQSTTTATMSSSQATATYRGDYPAYPIITFSITTAGSSAFSIVIDGATIRLDLSGATAGTYTLNYDTKQLLNASGSSKAGFFSSVTTFNPIQSGTTYKLINNTGGMVCSMTYREAFA